MRFIVTVCLALRVGAPQFMQNPSYSKVGGDKICKGLLSVIILFFYGV